MNYNPACTASDPSIAMDGETPVVTWWEGSPGSAFSGFVYVKKWAGASFSWVSLGGSLNITTSYQALWPTIAMDGSIINVAWCESLGTDYLYAKYLRPTTGGSWAGSPTVTPTVYVDLHGREVLAYPKPARAFVRFALAESRAERVKITMYNSLGERAGMLAADAPGQILEWDISSMAPGVYFYRVVLRVNGSEKALPVQKLAILK